MQRWVCAAALSILAVSASAALAAPGPDDFEDGTTQNWGAVTSNIATGGPAGANDNFMQFTSTGAGTAGSRLLATNIDQWTGDFTSIAAIEMDLRNTSDGARPMRLALRESNGTAGTPGYASSTAFNLPNDGTWYHVVFNINASSLTAVNGPPDLATFLMTVGNMRILSSVSPNLIGDQVAGQIGVDNITAIVPEPSALAIFAMAAATAVRRRR